MYLLTGITRTSISEFIRIVQDVLNVRVAIHLRPQEKYKSLSQFLQSFCLLEKIL